jgi:uncharacterized protein
MMTRNLKIMLAGVTALALGGAGIALAQQTSAPSSATPAPSPLSIALADGVIGEQADGYVGVKDTVSASLRSDVDALNIKRRALYTQLAQKRGVTIQEAAATFGCETLAQRVAVGRAYKLPDGVWRVRKAGETIALPPYCGT